MEETNILLRIISHFPIFLVVKIHAADVFIFFVHFRAEGIR